jgi:hypothetical protein
MGGIVNRLQIIAVLGLVTLSGCSAADEPADRPPADAGRDTRTTVVRSDGPSADRLDASGGGYADEASTTPEPDVAVPDGPSPPPDAPVPPPDGSPPDGSSPPPTDAPPPPPMDVTPDQMITSCVVSFTVTGVAWSNPEGGAGDAQVPGRAVRLVGDAANLGTWAPTSGVPLTETSPGTWAGTTTFRDQQLTEFKFVKMEGTTPEWENWLPYDSNRSLRVECFGDAGTLRDANDADAPLASDGFFDASGDIATTDRGAIDAGADTIDSGAPPDGSVVPVPARGRTYVGAFGVRPADATK